MRRERSAAFRNQGDEWVGMFADSAFSRQQFRRRQQTIGFRTARRTRAPRRSTSWIMALPIPRLAPIAVFKFAELAGEGAGPKVFSRRYCWVICISNQRKASGCMIILPDGCPSDLAVGSGNHCLFDEIGLSRLAAKNQRIHPAKNLGS